MSEGHASHPQIVRSISRVLAAPRAEAETELNASTDAVVSPGPTAFGLRQVENRSDPWCLSAISEESYGTASESNRRELEGVDMEDASSSEVGGDIGNGDDARNDNNDEHTT